MFLIEALALEVFLDLYLHPRRRRRPEKYDMRVGTKSTGAQTERPARGGRPEIAVHKRKAFDMNSIIAGAGTKYPAKFVRFAPERVFSTSLLTMPNRQFV